MIVGAGQTGQAVARYLSRHQQSFVIADDQLSGDALAAVRQLPGFVAATALNGDAVQQGERVVVSPGVPLTHPALRHVDVSRLTNDIALFAQSVNAPIAAITGSNGKSTVTQLVGDMAQACLSHVGVGGNIGVPCLDLIDDQAELYVLELSSYHLEIATQLPLKVAAILNLSPDHLDRYDTVQDYYGTKGNILNAAQRLVLNRAVVSHYAVASRQLITFGQDAPSTDQDFGLVQESGTRWLVKGQQKLINEHDLQVRGNHNLENVLAALAIGDQLGLAMDRMLTVAAEFTGLPHRSEVVAQSEGITWINDSKATNTGSAIAAIEGLGGDNNIVLIAGGDGKGADFSALSAAVQRHVKTVVVLGKDADLIAAELSAQVPVRRADTLSDAVKLSRLSAVSGDVVLLSPACASTDMFSSYADRGDQFKALVLQYAQGGPS